MFSHKYWSVINSYVEPHQTVIFEKFKGNSFNDFLNPYHKIDSSTIRKFGNEYVHIHLGKGGHLLPIIIPMVKHHQPPFCQEMWQLKSITCHGRCDITLAQACILHKLADIIKLYIAVFSILYDKAYLDSETSSKRWKSHQYSPKFCRQSPL